MLRTLSFIAAGLGIAGIALAAPFTTKKLNLKENDCSLEVSYPEFGGLTQQDEFVHTFFREKLQLELQSAKLLCQGENPKGKITLSVFHYRPDRNLSLLLQRWNAEGKLVAKAYKSLHLHIDPAGDDYARGVVLNEKLLQVLVERSAAAKSLKPEAIPELLRSVGTRDFGFDSEGNMHIALSQDQDFVWARKEYKGRVRPFEPIRLVK